MNITTFIEVNFPKTAHPTPGGAGTHGTHGTHGTQAGEVNFMELFFGDSLVNSHGRKWWFNGDYVEILGVKKWKNGDLSWWNWDTNGIVMVI